MLIELESAFWNHVQDGTPPPLDGSDASAKFLSERFPTSTPKSHITLPDGAVDLLAQYDEACEHLETVTEQKQRAENLLKFCNTPFSIGFLVLNLQIKGR